MVRTTADCLFPPSFIEQSFPCGVAKSMVSSEEKVRLGSIATEAVCAQARVCPVRPGSGSGINELQEGLSMLVTHSN